MNREDITQMLTETGLPFAYHHFAEGEAPACPYILYLYPESIPFPADDGVFAQGMQLQIELYTETRDPNAEQCVEAALDSYDLVYRKYEVFIESEHLYEVRYEMEVAEMG